MASPRLFPEESNPKLFVMIRDRMEISFPHAWFNYLYNVVFKLESVKSDSQTRMKWNEMKLNTKIVSSFI